MPGSVRSFHRYLSICCGQHILLVSRDVMIVPSLVECHRRNQMRVCTRKNTQKSSYCGRYCEEKGGCPLTVSCVNG